jgi:hypothetical protein
MISPENACGFWENLLSRWFGTLRYAHSASTHQAILDSLSWPAMRDVYESLHLAVSWLAFCRQVILLANRAQQQGLVIPDGYSRGRTTGTSKQNLEQRHIEDLLWRA